MSCVGFISSEKLNSLAKLRDDAKARHPLLVVTFLPSVVNIPP